MKTYLFTDLGISAPVLRAIEEMGYETPSKIQAEAIPKIRTGVDLAGQAQTGTGKTAAFGIPLLEKIDLSSGDVQAIIMCPTRELAVQVTGEIIKLAKYMDGLRATPVYGGQPIQRQIKQIRSGSQIVVGTPGRVIDHLKRGTLSLSSLKTVVLDEADEMLNMGFREDIEEILGFAEKDVPRQTVMFSATMSGEIKSIMKRWFNNPEMLRVEGKAASADGIRQFVVEARDSMRTEGISRLIDLHNYNRTLVFCNTKRTCDTLIAEMQSRGFSADALHGDMNQPVRDKVMNKFRQGRIDLLVATDVAARGLDVDDVDAVFNYDIPQDPEYYVHRIGRTGRAGKTGVAYTFSSGRKSRSIRFIENKLKLKLETIPLPSISAVGRSKMDALMAEVKETMESGGLRPYIEQIEAAIPDGFTPIEVAAALLKIKEQSGAGSRYSGYTSESPESEPESGDGESSRKGKGFRGRPDKKRKSTVRGEGKKKRKKDPDFTAGKSKKKKKKKKPEPEPFYAPFLKKGKGKGEPGRRKKPSS
ncbi:DEAD/DEAH box helicase [Natronogracilivirga saccharolytica]|uniref:RNA helicase n=1 Tax=Natronogracilivirga saccharolytica TaxID=2812953 RepID=A0A8J7UUN4_9BACT|nr:DEAD/DEAH box helicase [Natronogracilivirga saccharolytica]MBP3191641.1 DEAD/DEAH box helicase [Natronogracilivirga saccharolytica]